MNINIHNIQTSNGKVLIPFESGLAKGWKEGPALLPRGPIARPKLQMPLAKWREILSFLVDVFDEIKIEAQAIFYYKEANDEWAVFVPVQYGSGATTNTVDCEENTKGFEFLAREGYECVGSVHTHCTMSAFQSGVDKDDELGTNDGFHITIGKMQDAIMDIHCRSICTIMGDPNVPGSKAERVQVPFYLEEFISGLPDFEEMDNPPPLRIRNEWIKYILLNRDELEDFNEQWVDRIHKTDPTKKSPAQTWENAGTNGVRNGGTYLIAGVPHTLVNGHLLPVPSQMTLEEHAKQQEKLRADQQWWEQRQAKERALLEQLNEDEEKEELEAEEMRLLKYKQDTEDEDNARFLEENATVFGIAQ